MSPTYLFGISRVRPARTSLLLTTLVLSRWLDIGLVHFCVVIDLEFVLVHKNAKKRLVNNAYIDNPSNLWLEKYIWLTFITTTGF